MNNIYLILGMTLVTFIPRFIPFRLVTGENLPPKLKRFLQFIPYTALGALIFPGIFTAIPEAPWAAVAGATFALIIAWIKGGIILPVFGSIAVAYLILILL